MALYKCITTCIIIVVINILQGRAVTQTVLDGLFVQHSVANFLYTFT